jgi:HEAT repeat protein
MSDNKQGRANAALVMGRMGEPSAIGPLRTMIAEESDPIVKYNAVEALARLGDARAVRILESYVKGYYLDLRLASIPVLAEIRHPRTGYILGSLIGGKNPPRVRVMAAGGLGLISDDRGYSVCADALTDPEDILDDHYGNKYQLKDREFANIVSSLRRLAAISLGMIGDPKAIELLLPLLEDADGSVRIAAAMGVIKILYPGTDTGRFTEPGKKPEIGRESEKNPPRMYTSGGID